MDGWTLDWVMLSGWAAAGFTLTAYSMKTMLPLRLAGLAANVLFVIFAWFEGIPPTLVLHVFLGLLNLYRLREILRTRKTARAAISTDAPLHWIADFVAPVSLAPGETLFSRGDPPDYLYYIRKGRIRLEEIGVTLGEGEIFGEIAFFTDARARTVSAVAYGETEILRLDQDDMMKLYYQEPAFALYLVRLVARRLLDGTSRAPEIYRPAPVPAPTP